MGWITAAPGLQDTSDCFVMSFLGNEEELFKGSTLA